MSTKERAAELYQQHIDLAKTDGRLFRKTVMDTLMAETGCTLSAAATHYNTAKKAHEAANGAIEGLGRAPVPKGVQKPGAKKVENKQELQEDDDCFSVIEIDAEGNAGRCQSFLLQGDASEKFDDKVAAWPNTTWVLIQGLGPNSGDTFRLEPGEREIRRHAPRVEQTA